eukprot:292580-Chlamydomonas_euryale.AAC.1
MPHELAIEAAQVCVSPPDNLPPHSQAPTLLPPPTHPSQVVYGDALHELALEAARARPDAGSPAGALRLASLEDALVRIALDLVRFERDAGHSERAFARVQAAVEFHAFNPYATAAGAGAGGGAGLAGDGGGGGRCTAAKPPGFYASQLS